jgi:putative hydrolase of the HAD superfamily
MIKGIIFDMDGVVIDSNTFHYENWSNVFRKTLGVDISREDFAHQLGKSSKEFTEYFLDKYQARDRYEELIAQIRKFHDENHHKIILKDGFKPVLSNLKKKYRIALATGATKHMANLNLTRLGIIKYFDFIIAGDEVKRAKPDPEIFLKAASGLGLKPEECVVIEDAIQGITAAKSAGIKVISIPDPMTKHQDHHIADLRLDSIKDLTKEQIDRL